MEKVLDIVMGPDLEELKAAISSGGSVVVEFLVKKRSFFPSRKIKLKMTVYKLDTEVADIGECNIGAVCTLPARKQMIAVTNLADPDNVLEMVEVPSKAEYTLFVLSMWYDYANRNRGCINVVDLKAGQLALS